MIELKNVRPGVLVIADAKVRLDPGQIVAVNSLSSQMEKALELGMLTRVETTKAAVAAPLAPDLSKMTEKEAKEFIAKETDPNRLKAYMKKEKRPNVMEALSYQIAEVDGGSN